MAKRCTACATNYPDDLKFCPTCGIAAAPEVPPASQSGHTLVNAERQPPAPVENLATTGMPNEALADLSPFYSRAKDDFSSRVEVDERDSDYDLRLAWQDEEDPPPSPEEWTTKDSAGSNDEIDLNLVPARVAAPEADSAGSNDEIDLSLAPARVAVPGADSAGSNDEIDLNLVPARDQASAMDSAGSNDEIDLNLVPAGTPGSSALGSNHEIDLNLPPTRGAVSEPESAPSSDEIDLNLPPEAASPSVPAPVPIEQLLPWLSPAPEQPVPESRRLSILLFGVLAGAAACFGLWLIGLEPPSSWRLRQAAERSNAGLARPDSGAATDKEKTLHETGPKKTASTLFVERLAVDFAAAVDLAQNQKYSAAIELLQRLCASLEQRELLDLVGTNPEDEEAEQALLKTSYELLASWQVEQALAKQGVLSESRDTAEAVENLLVENRRLRKTFESLDSKLQFANTKPGAAGLAERLDRLLKTHEDAERQAALLPFERQRSADARKAAQEALTSAGALASRLQATESKLRNTETQMKELLARREASPQPKPIVLPALTLQPAGDTRLAYEHYTAGLGYYRDRHYPDAEKEFLAAVQADDQDARYHYYLGLARWSQGKQEAAASEFRAGARMERENKPSRVFVTLALERIDGAALTEMNRFRP